MILTFLLVQANPLIRRRCCRSFEIRGALGSNRVRRRFGADTRMKNADWLDVIARGDSIVTGPAATWESELRISIRGSIYTLRRIKNDSSWGSGLSKIAHMRRLRLPIQLCILQNIFIDDPALAAGARNNRCRPARRAESARWLEPGQWRSRRLRSRCSAYRHRRPSCIRRERQHRRRRRGLRTRPPAQRSTNRRAAGILQDSPSQTGPSPSGTNSQRECGALRDRARAILGRSRWAGATNQFYLRPTMRRDGLPA